MSRCRSCNCVMTPYELTIKYAETGEFVDLCNSCLRPIKDELNLISREDLNDELDSSDIPWEDVYEESDDDLDEEEF